MIQLTGSDGILYYSLKWFIYIAERGREQRILGFDVVHSAIQVSELPAPLQELEPYQIEDFLCIFKKKLMR